MSGNGMTAPSGNLGLRIIRAADVQEAKAQFEKLTAGFDWPARELTLAEVIHHGLPQKGLDDRVNTWRLRNIPNLARGVRRVMAARAVRVSNFYGSLYLKHLRVGGDTLDLGLASMRVVTNAGVGFIVDAFQDLAELETMKYHGIGTGATAEAASNTALVAEATTALNPDSTRATGSTTEAAANIYRTVATITVDGSVAATEHGVFSAASVGSGVLLDRSVFSVVNLAAGDSLQTTYDLTVAAGS